MIITLTPNPLLNLVCGDEVQSGRVNRVAGLAAQAEGKGINVARVLARWGCEVKAMGFAGGASGRWFGELLSAANISHHLTPTAADLRCGLMAGQDQHPDHRAGWWLCGD